MVIQEAKSRIISYLKSRFIPFQQDYYDDVERITMVYYGHKDYPDKTLESCIYFFTNCIECRVYYNEKASRFFRESNLRSELFANVYD